MKAAAVAAANSRLRKIERSSIGARGAALDKDEEREQDGGGRQAADHQSDRSSPRFRRARARRRGRSARPRRSRVPSRSRAALRRRGGKLAQDERPPEGTGQGERHVKPEDPVPGDRDQGAAQHRAEDEADRGDHRVRPHRQAKLLFGEGVGDESRRVGEEKGPPMPWTIRQSDQLGAVGREAGAERGAGEDAGSRRRGRLSAEEIREATGGEDQHGRGDHVGEDHPDQFEKARCRAPARGPAGR